MLLAMEASSRPCDHWRRSSNRLGAIGPAAALLPWQPAQTSTNFAAVGLPRPPPLPTGAPCVEAGAPAGGCCAGSCCAVIEATRAATPSDVVHGIDFITALL